MFSHATRYLAATLTLATLAIAGLCTTAAAADPTPSPERVSSVRALYSHLPSDILGLSGAVKLVKATTCRCPNGHLALVFESKAGMRMAATHTRQGQLTWGADGQSARVTLEPRSPEAAAIYGLCVRLLNKAAAEHKVLLSQFIVRLDTMFVTPRLLPQTTRGPANECTNP